MKANIKLVMGFLGAITLVAFVSSQQIWHLNMEVIGFLFLIIASPALIFLVSSRKENKKRSRQ